MLTIASQLTLLSLSTILLWLIVLVWLIACVITVYGLSRRRLLSPLSPTRTALDLPFVSVLVPARNEQNRILADCLRSILAQDYGRFEVIAVNDRSTDATGEILAALARSDDRLRVVEGEALPPGWLGKPYAMQQAFNHARGEWILATDADMIFDRTVLRTAIASTLEQQADAMTLIPHFEAKSFWERVMIPTWAWVLLMFTLFSRINNPKTPGAVGIGGFFLMRRSVLEHVGGYEALNNEVREDVRLAEMIKRSGHRLLTEHAPSLVSTRMYRNFGEMWECSTKNWFSGMKFSLPFALAAVLSMYLMAVVPPLVALACAIGLAMGVGKGLWLLFVPAILSWLLQIIVMAMAGIAAKLSPGYALTSPLGLGLLYAMLFDSSLRIKTGRGVTWRGRKVYERHGVRPPKFRNGRRRISDFES
jgi:cellulose synthase/poly-beta-1,6-N-acetylglucosamine synthase-like glycosyltransferase